MYHGLLAPAGSKVLLLGNEAIARGAIEAGIGFASAYPGTPSTEIIESLARVANEIGFYVEWSVNEKVAFESALGASYAGVRALVAMKHVGVNVAADPLMSSAYTGVNTGFVIISADDPNMWSSQNEQDNRFYGLHAFIPVFEAYCPMEVKELVKFAFNFSEKFKHPVIIRSTTRLSHARGPVILGEIPEIKRKGEFIKNPSQYALIPLHSRKLRAKLIEKWSRIKEEVNNIPFNKFEDNNSSKLIIASGIAYGYVKDSVKMLNIENKVNILKISSTVPLPEKIISEALSKADEVLIVEELEPLVEWNIKKIAFENNFKVKIYGKNYIPQIGELTINNVIEAICKFMKIDSSRMPKPYVEKLPIEIPSRPPTLCPGCPHRATFYILRNALSKLKIRNAIYSGDIGCYSLGVLPPFEMQDLLIEMGGSIGVANGLAETTNQLVIAIMGDSTFFHACIPGLINAVYNEKPVLALILDNRITAMTGHQPHPGTGIKATGEKVKMIMPEKIASGIGVEYIDVIDPYKVDGSIEKLMKALKYVNEKRKTALIIARRACALLIGMMIRRRGIRNPIYQVDLDKCRACGICYNLFGCPAISPIEDGKAMISEELCSGCGVCAQICPFNAIKLKSEGSPEWNEIWREV